MRRSTVLLLVVLLVVPTSALAAPAKVAVVGTTVTPSQPAPGELTTISATIQNGPTTGSSPSNAFEIRAVALRSGSGQLREYTRVEDVGTLSEGTTITVPLAVRFDDPGTKDLRVVVYGDSGEGPVELRYPVIVPVRRGGPQLGFDVDDAVVGAETGVNVTVVNGENATASGLSLTLAGDDASVADDTRVAPRLAPGEERSFRFEVTPTATETGLTARLNYTTVAGDDRQVEASTTLAADPLREDVRLSAAVGAGASPPVLVDVSNFGNAPLTDVRLTARANGDVVARRTVGSIADGNESRVALNVTGVDAADLAVVADYETGDREGTAETTVRYTANPGRIELTGVDVEREGDRVHLTGSASNVGLSEANGVLLEVVPGEGVAPARPYREFFVGTVPPSDFVSFDLYARTDESTASVPVRVSYLVDGERRTAVQEIPIDGLDPAPEEGETPGTSPLVLGGGVVAALVLVAVVGYAVYRR